MAMRSVMPQVQSFGQLRGSCTVQRVVYVRLEDGASMWWLRCSTEVPFNPFCEFARVIRKDEGVG